MSELLEPEVRARVQRTMPSFSGRSGTRFTTRTLRGQFVNEREDWRTTNHAKRISSGLLLISSPARCLMNLRPGTEVERRVQSFRSVDRVETHEQVVSCSYKSLLAWCLRKGCPRTVQSAQSGR